MRKFVHVLTMVCMLSVTLPTFSAFATEDNSVSFTGTDGTPVEIRHQETGNVSDARISAIIAQAKEAIQQERLEKGASEVTNAAEDSTYDYFFIDDGVTYLYEESPGSKAELVILDSPQQEQSSSAVTDAVYNSEYEMMADFISDGVGGRQRILQNGQYLSARLQLPYDYQVDPKGGAFNYGGFAYQSSASGGVGSWVGDMGLQYDTSVGRNDREKGWKPVVILKKKVYPDPKGWVQYSTVFDPGYQEATYKNAYQSASNVTFYVWYNYNGKIRLKIDGTTICRERKCDSPSPSHTISIIESNASWNISQFSYWKLLSTVISSDNTGKNKGIFTNIQVDGRTVSGSSYATPEEDRAKITRSGDTLTIDVDSSKYRD